MAVREVIKMGHPTLRQIASPLSDEEIASEQTRVLIQDLLDTMAEEEGIGIAAPQINISKQLAIVGIPTDNERYPDSEETEIYVVINPKITILDEEKQGFWEGCLSVPGLRGYVERPKKVQIDFIDHLGQEQCVIAEGFVATVFQHELDHLFGKIYVDHIKDKTKFAFNDEYLNFHEQESGEGHDE